MSNYEPYFYKRVGNTVTLDRSETHVCPFRSEIPNMHEVLCNLRAGTQDIEGYTFCQTLLGHGCPLTAGSITVEVKDEH